MMLIALTIVILILSLINFLIQQRVRNSPPGPFPWPIIGNQYHLKKLSQELGGQHYALSQLCKQYNSGIISLKLGVGNIIVVSSNKLIHEVLSKEEFDGRPWDNFAQMRNMGMRKGITMNDGPEWKILRNWSIRTLKNIGFARPEMIQLLMDELATILEKLKSNDVQCIQSVTSPSVINVLWMLVTGKKASECKRLPHFIKLLHRRGEAFKMTGTLVTQFPWIRHIIPEASGYNAINKLNNELKNFLMDTINEHRLRYVKDNEADFIDLFLREIIFTDLYETETSAFTDENLLMTLFDFFIAGTNTTISALGFLFLEMIRNRDVQRKLHDEIDDIIGSERLPNLEDKLKMPYTEAILTESSRIWNPTPIIGPRRVLRDTSLGGYTIPKESTILMNIFNNNMNPKMYPEPTLFKPERFIENGVFQSDQNLVLFGKGKRRCPGEALAKSAIFLLFIGIMQKYQILPVPGKEYAKVDVVSGVLISPKPYDVLIVPR